MPAIDQNRLKGNYAAAYVMSRLSGECLVRPVAADTDLGVDLYCETVEGSFPFLHFWIQVKGGDQCHLLATGEASCAFKREHLDYWLRQPVPVFAALVPTAWPVLDEPAVYIVNITDQLLEDSPTGATHTMRSNSCWNPTHKQDVSNFLLNTVPQSTARLQCKNGIVTSTPTSKPEYVVQFPPVPVARFSGEILDQIRRTAAMSIIHLWKSGELNEATRDFRCRLANVLKGYDNIHWETPAARAFSCHADHEWKSAQSFYTQALSSIQNDPNVAQLPYWQAQIEELKRCKQKAAREEEL